MQVLAGLLLCLLLTADAHAGRIWVDTTSQYMHYEHIKVCVVGDPNDADLFVWEVFSKWDHRMLKSDGLWYFLESIPPDNTPFMTIKYVAKERAEVKIHFVRYEHQAGWAKLEVMREYQGKFSYLN